MPRKVKSIIDFYDIESSYMTDFNRLIFNIIDSRQNSDLKSFMITSSMLAEGKSTICSMMGLTASLKKGLKTLIIDCDLRRPSIHRFFNISNSPGMTDILSDAFNPKDAIFKTSINKLDILPVGTLKPNPSEIFDPESIGNMIEEMKFYYDLILVDSPPLIPVSDPMILAPFIDAILIVVKSGATQKEVVRRAVDILAKDKNKILGLIMNNVNQSLPYHYNYSYYNYEYKNPKINRSGKTSRQIKSRNNKKQNVIKGMHREDNISEEK